MPDQGHIDLETIEKYLGGKLAAGDAEAVRKHLASCPLCSLELKRLERFAAIDADDDLARQAEWLYARTKLEAAFKEKTPRSVPGTGAHKVVALRRAPRIAQWLVPAAAAAVVIAVFSYVALKEKPGAPAPATSVTEGAGKQGIMRGAPPPAEYGIKLTEPIGELKAFPEIFKWESKRKENSFTLEIFTPKLEKIYQARNIAESSWKAPDSLKTVLKSNVIYLWSVRGHQGLERPTASPNGWFKIVPRI